MVSQEHRAKICPQELLPYKWVSKGCPNVFIPREELTSHSWLVIGGLSSAQCLSVSMRSVWWSAQIWHKHRLTRMLQCCFRDLPHHMTNAIQDHLALALATIGILTRELKVISDWKRQACNQMSGVYEVKVPTGKPWSTSTWFESETFVCSNVQMQVSVCISEPTISRVRLGVFMGITPQSHMKSALIQHQTELLDVRKATIKSHRTRDLLVAGDKRGRLDYTFYDPSTQIHFDKGQSSLLFRVKVFIRKEYAYMLSHEDHHNEPDWEEAAFLFD